MTDDFFYNALLEYKIYCKKKIKLIYFSVLSESQEQFFIITKGFVTRSSYCHNIHSPSQYSLIIYCSEGYSAPQIPRLPGLCLGLIFFCPIWITFHPIQQKWKSLYQDELNHHTMTVKKPCCKFQMNCAVNKNSFEIPIQLNHLANNDIMK